MEYCSNEFPMCILKEFCAALKALDFNLMGACSGGITLKGLSQLTINYCINALLMASVHWPLKPTMTILCGIMLQFPNPNCNFDTANITGTLRALTSSCIVFDGI